jgi:F0F1-type ATP synthase membrane subunit c/vacuolar-type H+-ATPase subunit K
METVLALIGLAGMGLAWLAVGVARGNETVNWLVAAARTPQETGGPLSAYKFGGDR